MLLTTPGDGAPRSPLFPFVSGLQESSNTTGIDGIEPPCCRFKAGGLTNHPDANVPGQT